MRYGSSPFSLICSLLLKDLSFDFILPALISERSLRSCFVVAMDNTQALGVAYIFRLTLTAKWYYTIQEKK